MAWIWVLQVFARRVRGRNIWQTVGSFGNLVQETLDRRAPLIATPKMEGQSNAIGDAFDRPGNYDHLTPCRLSSSLIPVLYIDGKWCKKPFFSGTPAGDGVKRRTNEDHKTLEAAKPFNRTRSHFATWRSH
jgi:hypothetical protein